MTINQTLMHILTQSNPILKIQLATFIKNTKNLRIQQSIYFKTRSKESLTESIQLEKRVDEFISLLEKISQSK